MRAHVGDRIVLAQPTVDAPLRDGEVLETRGAGGAPPFLIRWSDGHEGLFFPGPGSVLSIGTSHPASTDQLNEPARQPATDRHFSASTGSDERRHVRDWQVRVTIFESDNDTHANVVLLADSAQLLTARGESERGPHDRPVPEVGAEVAVARALRHLADRLLATAEDDIEALTGEHDVTVRPT